MAYRLKAKESVADGIKRIVREELDSTSQLLSDPKSKRDEAIHEARKSLKKIRGVLRLVRPELGQVYRDENRRFRDLGRQLSPIRDAVAVIEVFDSLAEEYQGRVEARVLQNVHRTLVRKKREMEAATDLKQLATKTVTALRSAGRRLNRWPLSHDGFSAIQDGLEGTYRRGRRALREAKAQPEPDRFHFLRKRVKDHWYHVRLLESLWTELMQARESDLKNVETWLGDDHNLVVLCDMIRRDVAGFGGEKNAELVLRLLEQQQADLRAKAMSFADRTYEQKPRRFVKDISKLWDQWQAQPRVAKEVQSEQRDATKKPAQNARRRRPAA